jgi:cell division septum initiation protein DivIVA
MSPDYDQLKARIAALLGEIEVLHGEIEGATDGQAAGLMARSGAALREAIALSDAADNCADEMIAKAEADAAQIRGAGSEVYDAACDLPDAGDLDEKSATASRLYR